MANEEKQVQELQAELKILKNEIKESLVGVRDFLLTYAENPFKIQVEPVAATVVAATIGASPQAAEPRREAPPTPPYRGPEPDPSQEAKGSRAPEPPYRRPEPDAGQEAEGPSVPADPQPALSAPSSATEGDSGMSATEPQGLPMEDLPPDRPKPLPPSNGKQSIKPVSPNGDFRDPRPSPGDMPAAYPQQPMEQARGQADLATVAMLAPWLEDCLPRLGRTRVKGLVKLYADMGGLPPECKSTLLQLIELDGHAPPKPKAKASLRECLQALVELDTIIVRSRHDRTGAAILAVYLSSMAGPPSGQATPEP